MTLFKCQMYLARTALIGDTFQIELEFKNSTLDRENLKYIFETQLYLHVTAAYNFQCSMVFTRVSTHFSVIHDGIFRVLKISARSRRDCGCLSSLGKVTKISARFFRRRTKIRRLPLPSHLPRGQHSPRLRLPLPLQRDFCMAKNLRSWRDLAKTIVISTRSQDEPR